MQNHEQHSAVRDFLNLRHKAQAVGLILEPDHDGYLSIMKSRTDKRWYQAKNIEQAQGFIFGYGAAMNAEFDNDVRRPTKRPAEDSQSDTSLLFGYAMDAVFDNDKEKPVKRATPEPVLGQEAVVPEYGLGRVVEIYESSIDVRAYCTDTVHQHAASNVRLVEINYVQED